jgi:hypothetical protein
MRRALRPHICGSNQSLVHERVTDIEWDAPEDDW